MAQSPITVKLMPKKAEAGLGDVLLGSLGLTGVMVLCAIVAGVLFAAVLFVWRSKKPLEH